MTILDKIIARKHQEIEESKRVMPVEDLMAMEAFKKEVPSLSAYLADPSKSGIIAEHKRQSPSKGIINNKVTVQEVVTGYEKAGASALSVLTDKDFFGGSNEDLVAARAVTTIPILRKDFIISPYQIYEAKAIGASAILLIAAVLDDRQAFGLGYIAHQLGLEVLMELHDESELSRINEHVDVVGINNRNLKTFEVSLEKSIELAKKLPADRLKISESGIHSAQDVFFLRENGFQGFLIGESFMKTENPGQACIDFCQQIKR